MNHRPGNDARLSVQDRIREGIKAVLEQVMEEELAEQLQAGHRERTDTRRGELWRLLQTRTDDRGRPYRAAARAEGP